jgi:hypothetical protein
VIPDFVLPDSDGVPHRLSEFTAAGLAVLIYARGSWCPFCLRQLSSYALIEDKDAYHFYFDMPGLKAESLDVQMEDDQLTVAAERKRPEGPQETEVHIARRGHGPLRRAFKLPANASRDGIPPGAFKVGRTWRIDLDELLRFLEAKPRGRS